MNYKTIILLFSILIFSLACDETTLPKDCLGDEGGTAYLDECGVCDADSNNDNITCFDCTGEINGSYVLDECKVCDIYSSYNNNATWDNGEPFVDANANDIWDDAENFNDSNSNGVWDDAEEFEDINSNGVWDDAEDYTEIGEKPTTYPYGDCDCAGLLDGNAVISGCDNTCGSILVEDNCDICGGDNSTCSDCAGEYAGAAYLNECGTCICNGSESLDGYECVVSDECIQDCNNDWGGDNYECIQDCNGDWDGSASIDCSGECRGGNTAYCIENDSLSETDCDDLENTWDENLAYTICACFDTTADNFYCHEDADECYSNPSVDTCCENNTSVDASCNSDCILLDDILASQFSNPYIDSAECEYTPINMMNPPTQGCLDSYENPHYGLVYHDSSLCEIYGCTDVNATNYDVNATNCLDGTESCCDYLFLYLDCNGVVNNSINIYITNSIEVAGFQFDIVGQIIGTGSNGLAAENNFAVYSAGATAIAFDLGGAIIPMSTNQLLTSLPLTDYEDGDVLTLSNLVMSDINGEALQFEVGDCYLDPTP